MRWPLLAGVVGGAATGLLHGCVESCYEDPGYNGRYEQDSPIWGRMGAELPIPVDAAPWMLRPCGTDAPPDDCVLVRNGATIAVEVRFEGLDGCDGDQSGYGYGYYGYNPRAQVIQRFIPAEPLTPGRIFSLQCGDVDDRGDPYGGGGYGYYYYGQPMPQNPLMMRIRTSDDPAAPPAALSGLNVHYTRGDDSTFCSGGDFLEVSFDFDEKYLAEGGYVEVEYPGGQLFTIYQPGPAGHVVLPGSRGPIAFTPVAVDGERGDTVNVDRSQMTDELAYVPGCAVDPGGGGADPAWLLLPAAWLRIRRRRLPGRAGEAA